MSIEFHKIIELIKLTKNTSVKYRIIDIDNEIGCWNDWLSNPTGRYLDYGKKPIPYSEVKKIEIDPVEDKYIGKLVPNKLIDHTKEITNILNSLRIEFKIIGRIITINSEN